MSRTLEPEDCGWHILGSFLIYYLQITIHVAGTSLLILIQIAADVLMLTATFLRVWHDAVVALYHLLDVLRVVNECTDGSLLLAGQRATGSGGAQLFRCLVILQTTHEAGILDILGQRCIRLNLQAEVGRRVRTKI